MLVRVEGLDGVITASLVEVGREVPQLVGYLSPVQPKFGPLGVERHVQSGHVEGPELDPSSLQLFALERSALAGAKVILRISVFEVFSELALFTAM